ncbi:MAG TPA: replicative DNA helicase, partial [Anseongella sp.]|nr:replicative DNA helicase [Anseongella sp.]
ALTKVIEFLKPEMFYKDSHQKIYEAIRYLFDKTQPIDILTVTQRLRQSGELDFVGGAFYITELTNRVASAANIEYHARIISEKYIQRKLISISTEIINSAYEETSDVFELLDSAEKNLFSIAETNLRRNFDSMSGLVKRSLEHLEEMMKREDGLTGVPTGFSALDRITSGWQNSDLVILAARPGMGKTAFILSAVRNAAVDFKKPVAVFSLEMSSIQLVNRLISGEAELPQDKLRKGNLASYEWEQLHAKIGKLIEAPIFIDDTPALSIFELRAKCRRMKAQHNIEMVVVDYLQLMKGSADNNRTGNREQEISSISRGLKAIAKELEVPVIALSQLSRAVEQREDKRPMLSDLRES